MSNASATTITVNTGLFAAGDIVTIVNLGAGVCTITAGTATVTTSGSLALAINQGGVLRFTSASAAIFFQFATPASGDIEGVTAGTGISGGGTSGTVTITNSMATTIDAKGDLVVGTGADTFARLAVGTNGHTLVADSSVSPQGLKWAVDPVADVVTTAGDLLYATAADTVTRLGIGTAGQVLQVNSGATAPEWTTASSGGMTLIASTTPTGAGTVTFSSIPATYKHLLIIIEDLSGTSNISLNARFNGDTGGNYARARLRTVGSTVTGAIGDNGASSMYLGQLDARNTNAWERAKHILWIYDYASTTNLKTIDGKGFSYDGTNTQFATYFGVWNNTSAVSSVTIFDGNGPYNFNNGTLKLYGVS
jgi:hypothetical protein